jgi:hypothetical protein
MLCRLQVEPVGNSLSVVLRDVGVAASVELVRYSFLLFPVLESRIGRPSFRADGEDDDDEDDLFFDDCHTRAMLGPSHTHTQRCSAVSDTGRCVRRSDTQHRSRG